MHRRHFNLFADYFQFYLQDEGTDGDLSDAWTQEALDRLLAVAPGTIGVGTARNMTVPVEIEIHPAEPPADFAEWDHVNESSLNIPSGRIVVAGCTDYFPDAARIAVAPGSYVARISYGGLDSLSADGLSGDDRYRVQLWPGVANGVRVLKQRG